MKTSANTPRILTGRIAAACAFAILNTYSTQANSATWTGATDAQWSVLTNWTSNPNPVPGTTNIATFDNAGGAVDTIDLGAGVTINTVIFDTANAAAYTIGGGTVGSQILTLDNGGAVTVDGAVTNDQLFSSALVLGNDGSTQSFAVTNSSATAGLTFAGNITGSTGAGVKTLAVGGAGHTNISGVIADGTSGSVKVTKSGGGTLTLSNANTYTGGTVINAGTLAESAGGFIADTGALTVDGATAVFNLGANHSDTVGAVVLDGGGQITGTGTSKLTGSSYALKSGSISAALGAGGGITKTTAGTVTLTGNSSGSTLGGTTVSAGTLAISNGGQLKDNGGTVDGAGAGFSVAGSGSSYTTSGLTVGNAASTNTLSISSGAAVTVNNDLIIGFGAGTGNNVVVSGSGSRLDVGFRLGLGYGSGANSSLTFSGGATGSTGLMWTAGAFNNANNGQNNTSLTITGPGSAFTVTGAYDLADRGSGSTVNVLNGGTLTSNGGDGYFGYFGATNNTILVDGNGSVWNTRNLNTLFAPTGSSNAITVSNGGKINSNSDFRIVGGNDTVNLSSGGVLVINQLNISSGTATLNFNDGILQARASNTLVTGAGKINLNGPGLVDTAGFSPTIVNLVQGGGSLTKIGSGTLTVTAANTYTGNTVVNAGTLVADTVTNATVLSTSSALVLGGGTFQFKGKAATVRSQILAGLTLNPGANVVDANDISGGNSTTLDLSGTSGLLGITRTALGTVDFKATTGTFGTTAVIKTAQANVNGILGAWATVAGGASLAANNGSNVVVAYTDYNNNGAFILDAQAGGPDTFVIADSAGTNYRITAAGSGGDLTLGAATTNINTLSHDFATPSQINTTGGKLRVGTTGGILITPSGSDLTIGNAVDAGTLTAGGGSNDVAGDLILGNFSASTLTVNSTMADNGTGAVTLTKSGSGTLVLLGTNTYTGTTTINQGVVIIQNAAALGTTAGGTVVAFGAALQIQDVSVGAEALTLNGTGVSNTGALRNNSGANTYGGLITLGSTTRINSNFDSLTLSNAGTITGPTFGLTVGGNSDTTINSIIGTTSGTLTKDGVGTLILTGANTYTGATTISAGTLQLGNAGTTGSLSPAGSITNNATLIFNRTNTLTQGTDFASVITGNGVVKQLGTGTTILNGANTYLGLTTVGGGVLQLGLTNAIKSGNAVTVAPAGATGTLDLAGFNQTIGGAGLRLGGETSGSAASVINSTGTSTLTLSGGGAALTYDNTHDPLGAIISVATVSLNGSAGTTFTVNDSGSVLTTGNELVISSAIIAGGAGGALTKAGAGTLKLDGLQTYNTLTTTGGTTNVNNTLGISPGQALVSVTGAGTKLKFGSVSQTLSSLSIGADATVVFTSGTASGAFSGGGGGKAPGFGGGSAVVPEPGTIGLLLVGALGMLNRRRRQA